MKIKINGKEYEPSFNMKFVRLLDKHRGITMEVPGAGKQPFGMAMTRVVPALKTYDTGALSDGFPKICPSRRPSCITVPHMNFWLLPSCRHSVPTSG